MRTIRRTISKYNRLWDLQRNPRQTDPAGTRRQGQRPAVNDLSEDMREKPDNLYEAIAARGEGAAGAHPETSSSFVRDNPHEKTVCKRFATVCGIFGFSSRNRDLTSLRSFYLFCLPQGRYRTCASRCATNGPKRKNRFQATLKRFSLSFLRLRRFRSFEPKPRFELGTPSLRVKCSTAELYS